LAASELAAEIAGEAGRLRLPAKPGG